jgi:soluble lytic murein transglycosylase-like protein
MTTHKIIIAKILIIEICLNLIVISTCFDRAAVYQGVNANVLRAIATKENRKCDEAISENKDGSIDAGCMQINSVHFKELLYYGITPNDLTENDQCKNIFIGAWHYKKMIRKYGNTWTAVGAYHSQTPHLRDAYAADVYRIWKQMD